MTVVHGPLCNYKNSSWTPAPQKESPTSRPAPMSLMFTARVSNHFQGAQSKVQFMHSMEAVCVDIYVHTNGQTSREFSWHHIQGWVRLLENMTCMMSYSGCAPTLLVEKMYILDYSLLACHGGYGDGLGEPPTVIDKPAKTGETRLPASTSCPYESRQPLGFSSPRTGARIREVQVWPPPPLRLLTYLSSAMAPFLFGDNWVN